MNAQHSDPTAGISSVPCADSLLVIGAGGGIGRATVELALQTGAHVTAVLRDPAKLPIKHTHLDIVRGDILRPETYESRLRGTSAVISAIGVRGGLLSDKPTTLYSEGNAQLLAAMERMETRRVFFISASAVEISPALPPIARFAAKYILQRLLKHMYTDLRAMERVVKASRADWTIVRPPRLTNGRVTGRYRWASNEYLKNSLSIARGDVAHLMIHHVTDPSTFSSVVEIGY